MIHPVNRYLQIKIAAPKQVHEETTILLPADFKPLEEKHITATTIAWADDVRFAKLLKTGTKVVVDKSMVEEIQVESGLITVVQDNYIIAIVTE